MDSYVYGVTALAVIMAVVLYSTFSRRKSCLTIPGPSKSHPTKGNLPDLTRAGSIHVFLQDLHKRYGPITRFWFGEEQIVSIASPALLKEQARVFDRPRHLHRIFEQLWTRHSLTYTNGAEARTRHMAYSRCFTHETLQKRYHILEQYSRDFCRQWASLPTETHIPLTEHMLHFAIKTILTFTFGHYFIDDMETAQFKEAYDATWAELEYGTMDVKPDAKKKEKFEKYKALMFRMLGDARRVANEVDLDKDLFVQVVQDVNHSTEVIDADMLTMCVAGFHTTGILLTWSMYFLATHPEIQEKLYKEVADLVADGDITFDAIPKMHYMKQVLDETLRCGVLSTYATRVQQTDSTVGGHKIPAGTPVVHAIGVILTDENLWPNASKFDPERFSPENKKSIPSYTFEPFGFAGKRKCPGYRLSYVEASLLLGDLVRKFKLNLVEGQTVETMYGFVTKPRNEIWITVDKRA